MPDYSTEPTDAAKQALVKRLNAARSGLLRIVRGLPEQQLEAAALQGGWSIKDVVGHIASWEDRLLTLAQMLINREEYKIQWITSGDDVDAWNRTEYLRKREWSWQETIRNLALVREELLWNLGWATLEELFELHLAAGETASAAGMMEEVIDHDTEHTAQLVAWLNSQPSSFGSESWP